jgi:hypothetical protein
MPAIGFQLAGLRRLGCIFTGVVRRVDLMVIQKYCEYIIVAGAENVISKTSSCIIQKVTWCPSASAAVRRMQHHAHCTPALSRATRNKLSVPPAIASDRCH